MELELDPWFGRVYSGLYFAVCCEEEWFYLECEGLINRSSKGERNWGGNKNINKCNNQFGGTCPADVDSNESTNEEKGGGGGGDERMWWKRNSP